MTAPESIAKARNAQLDAAKLEFAQHFKPELIADIPAPYRKRVEHIAWKSFLDGKGWKK